MDAPTFTAAHYCEVTHENETYPAGFILVDGDAYLDYITTFTGDLTRGAAVRHFGENVVMRFESLAADDYSEQINKQEQEYLLHMRNEQ